MCDTKVIQYVITDQQDKTNVFGKICVQSVEYEFSSWKSLEGVWEAVITGCPITLSALATSELEEYLNDVYSSQW